MEMHEAIKNFNSQFSYQPKIENGARLGAFKKYVILGMGGSHLAADLLRVWKPELDIIAHYDYGLPYFLRGAQKDTLVIASSYSGNTEETLDGFQKALERGFTRVIVSVGGKLLELAKSAGVPYIKLPDTGLQPRMATGYSFMSLLKIMGEEQALKETGRLSTTLQPKAHEAGGRKLAERLKGFIPVIYASSRNRAIAYNWKIKFNETGKIPAFTNIFPELNHNEMTGFDAKEPTRQLSQNFYFIILRDASDHPKILKRMEVMGKLFRERNLPVEAVPLEGKNIFMKIFSSLILADWAAYYTGEGYGLETTEVPMVEEFKKLL